MTFSLALSILSFAVALVVALAVTSNARELRLLRQHVVSLRKLSGIDARLIDPDTREEVLGALEMGVVGALVLVIDENCSICDEVVPLFVEAVRPSSTNFTATVVTRAPVDIELPGDRVQHIADRRLHHHLDPGYLPALHVLSPSGEAVLTEPVGSREGLLEALALAGVAVAS